MDDFKYSDGVAFCESVPLAKIAEEICTPVYVYSRATVARACERLKNAFASYPTLIAYAVKANSNLSVMSDIFHKDFGADVVSIGELERAMEAGAKPHKILFSGVAKTNDEIERAVEHQILSFNVESVGEVKRIAAIAKRKGQVAQITIRINPNVDAKTNPHISTGMYTNKFGIAEQDLPELLSEIKQLSSLKLIGVGCHIGSQITELQPFRDASSRMANLALELKADFPLEQLDLGGGLGVTYDQEVPPAADEYAKVLIEATKPTGLNLVIEPGRSVVGNAGVLITRVIGTKRTPMKKFALVDAAMNDLLRPSLYSAYHEVLPVKQATADSSVSKMDIVGPICESGDFIAKDREMPEVKDDDLLFIRTCGAYASSMASNYNSRPRAAEVYVSGGDYQVVRPRESMTSIWESER